MPAPNSERRAELTDAAIVLVAAIGLRGLTHRALDRAAGVPLGTASNYFRTRNSLLMATAARLVELQRADLAASVTAATTLSAAAEAMTDALVAAATTDRARWTALFEFQAETRRDPRLAEALSPLRVRSENQTAVWHRTRRSPIGPEQVPILQALFGGALQELLAMPTAAVTRTVARRYARTMILGIRNAG